MLVKCKVCGEKNEKNEMEVLKKGKANHYYHKECLERHLKHQTFLDKEREEQDSLWETIKDIHGMIMVPSDFFAKWIIRLRNGSIVEKGRIVKKYKQGVPYSVMKDAYLLCRKDIQYHKSTKNFESDMQELIYGFKIVTSKINEAYARQARKAKHIQQKNIVHEHEIVEDKPKTQYKYKKDNNDISDFLND
jgi:hypothetical protein